MRFFILLCVIGLFSSIVVGEDSNYWNWAWRSYDLVVEEPEDQRGDLIAFLPDGTINVLLSDIYPVSLRRINEASAFVGIRQGDEWYLYYLSANSAHPIIFLFDHAYFIEIKPSLSYDGGYDYLVPDFIPIGDEKFLIFNTNLEIYAIYDVVSHQTTRLNLKPWCDRDCVRVSEDGRYIRYYVRGDDPYYIRLTTYQFFTYPSLRELPYQLYEYDTVTQTERLFYEEVAVDTDKEDGKSSWGGCTPDEYGERWFCTLFLNQHIDVTPIPTRKFIVDTDGHIEDVNQNWELRVLDKQWYFLDVGSGRFGCSDCAVKVYPDGNIDESFEFIIPENEHQITSYNIQLLSEQHLLSNPNISPMYAISRSGELIELGVRDCCTDPISSDTYDHDTGFLILIQTSNGGGFTIWDTRALKVLATFPGGYAGVNHAFRDRAVVVFGGGALFNLYGMYSLIDEQKYVFNLDGSWWFLDTIANGAILVDRGSDYQLARRYMSMDEGIYVWRPDEGETLLVDGAVDIPSR